MNQVLTFDIGGTNVKYGFFSTEGQLLRSGEIPTEAEKGGPAMIQRLIQFSRTFSSINRIGISSAGQIDSKTGRVVFATDAIPGYRGTETGRLFHDALGVSIAVLNDANAAVLGESLYGAAKGCDTVIGLTYGTGIGGGIVIHHQLFEGSTGIAAEFGHFPIHATTGRRCLCGKIGCYEAYASTRALLTQIEAGTGKHFSGRQLFDEDSRILPEVYPYFEDWINEISIGLAGLIHIFNPDCIVLGGGIMQQPTVINAVTENLSAHILPSFFSPCLVPAKLGNMAGLYGAYAKVCQSPIQF